MPIVSLIVEALRAYPVAVFWIATLAQALIWLAAPALFYDSPPGDLPQTLAIGREWQLGSWNGPPLAFWLAEIAFRAAGGRVFGVYALAQVCVVTAYWAVFTLGRAVMGAQHATLAVLLMTGIIAFSMPTPEFGPAVLAMPLTAVALLLLWRGLGEERRNAWIGLGIVLGLLLLTTYWALVLFALIALFLLATGEGRDALRRMDPAASLALALLIALPHWAWMHQNSMLDAAASVPAAREALARLAAWPVLLLGIAALHGGMLALVALASGWRRSPSAPPPQVEGLDRKPLARRFVLFFAIALPLAATAVAAALGAGGTAVWAAPLVLLSGLAVVFAAGPRILIHRQHIVGGAWLAVLALPPLLLGSALLMGPWTGTFEPETDQPAAAMGQFFTETFHRRTGRPLGAVVGDARAAYVVALASPDRPRVFSPANPARTPWISADHVRRSGAVVIWSLADATGRPPPAVLAHFPDLVAEVPHSFPRGATGLAPALRIGWGVIRPQTEIQKSQ